MNKAGLNRLELRGKHLLENMGLCFKQQVLLEKIAIVDVFIPEMKLVIQWDGNYWHGHPLKIKGGKPDRRQKSRMDKDVEQDTKLKNLGYTVIRVWDSDLKHNEEAVIENIQRTISKITRRI